MPRDTSMSLQVCMSMQLTQSNYNIDSSTKSSNYMKIQLKALNCFELQETSKWYFELQLLQIRQQLNSLQISGTSN